MPNDNPPEIWKRVTRQYAQKLVQAPHYELYHDFAMTQISGVAKAGASVVEFVAGRDFVPKKISEGLAKNIPFYIHQAEGSSDAEKIECATALAAGAQLRSAFNYTKEPQKLQNGLARFFESNPKQAEATRNALLSGPYRAYFKTQKLGSSKELVAACTDYFEHASVADCAILGHKLMEVAVPPALYAVSDKEFKTTLLDPNMPKAPRATKEEKAAASKPRDLTPAEKEMEAFTKRAEGKKLMAAMSEEITAMTSDNKIETREVDDLIKHIQSGMAQNGLSAAAREMVGHRLAIFYSMQPPATPVAKPKPRPHDHWVH